MTQASVIDHPRVYTLKWDISFIPQLFFIVQMKVIATFHWPLQLMHVKYEGNYSSRNPRQSEAETTENIWAKTG